MTVVFLPVALLNAEFFAVPAYVMRTVVMAGLETVLARRYRDADPPRKLEAMVTAALALATVMACLGMLTRAAGSPAIGIKPSRVLTLLKRTVWRVETVFLPESAVRVVTPGVRRLSEEQFQREYTEGTVVLVLWVLFLMLMTALPSDFRGDRETVVAPDQISSNNPVGDDHLREAVAAQHGQ